MTTNDDEVYYRALLQGHYNKRCKQEIPKDHQLSRFSLTGFGLKLRAHPMAIALANEQFNHLDEWREQKHQFALRFMKAMVEFPFLKFPNVKERQPSWYALVMQFDHTRSNGVSIDQFVKALLAEGLLEVDRPGSTKPIHQLPLFADSHDLSKRFKQVSGPCNEHFPRAENFYKNAIKLPVWAHKYDEHWVNLYIQGFLKVCYAVLLHPASFKKGEK